MSVLPVSFIISSLILPSSFTQDAINCHRREKEARDAAEKLQASLTSELEKTREEKLAAEKRVISGLVCHLFLFL